MPVLKWGVAGYGDIVRRRALPALLSLSRAASPPQTVSRVWGRDPARAAALCAELGVGRGTGDFAELLECSDVVYIATPVVTHLPLALAAARAGRPVLVEKPLGLLFGGDPPVFPPGALIGVAYYRRLAPALIRLRDLLAGRAVRSASVTFRSAFDPAPDDPRHWRTDPAVGGGGVLADVGSHRLDLLAWLLGEPVVDGAALGRRFPLGAEREARVGLRWPHGARADLSVTWEAGPPLDRLHVEFEGGHLEVEPLDAGRIRGVVDGRPLAEDLPPGDNSHVPLLADFARSVRAGTPPACPVEDAMIVDRLITAVYTYAEEPS